MSGKVIVGNYIKLAYKRFLSDLNREDLTYDIEAGQRPIKFFEKYLVHHEGEWAGKPLKLELWQKAMIEQIFGWKLKNGLRRVRDVYTQIARKNGKTALVAGIAAFHLLADVENAPQILFGSNNEDQAKIGTTSAGRMIECSSRLKNYVQGQKLKIYKYKGKVKAMNFYPNGGVLEAMSADPTTKDGFTPSLGVVDEYHEAKDDLLLNVIESGQGARSQSLLLTITTAGFHKAGPCYSKLRKNAVDVLDGVKEDDGHLSFIYEIDTEDDWEDESVWVKSSPNLNVSVSLEWMRSRYQKAKNQGGSKEVDFKTKNLNVWTDAPKTWIDAKIVKANSKGNIRLEDLQGLRCYGGLDIGGSGDLSAYANLFVNDDHIPFAAKLSFWIPEEKVKAGNDLVDYRLWVQQGYMEEMPGRTINNEQITQDILHEIEVYDLQRVDFDPYKADHGIIQGLQDHEIICEPLAQTTKFLGVPFERLEEMINLEQLELFNNPVLEWMFGNVVVFTDTSGNRKPDRKKSLNKIDGVAALVNAFGGYITAHNEEQQEYTITWL